MEGDERRQPNFVKIASLRPDTSGHNIIVKVLELDVAIERPAEHGAKQQRVLECLVGDETGTIIFSAINEQGDLVQPGTYLVLRNAKVEMIKARMRLAVDKFGKISVPEQAYDFEVKKDFNMSDVEYELVPIGAFKTEAQKILPSEEKEEKKVCGRHSQLAQHGPSMRRNLGVGSQLRLDNSIDDGIVSQPSQLQYQASHMKGLQQTPTPGTLSFPVPKTPRAPFRFKTSNHQAYRPWTISSSSERFLASRFAMHATGQRSLSQLPATTPITPQEEPEEMEEEANLLDAFAKVPTLSRGWAHTASGPDGGVRITLQFAQRNLPENTQRKFMTNFLPNERVLGHGTLETSMPVDLGNATLVSPSPSGQTQFIVRPGSSSDTSSVLEIWNRSRLTLELHVPEALHGPICNDGWFGTGAAWSPDETLVAYVAESPVDKRTPEWGTLRDEDDETKKKIAAPKGWRGVGEFLEDWGELNTGKRSPTLFVLNVESGKVEAVQGLPKNATFGQPVWSPDGSYLIFVCWEHQSINFPLFPQRLGIVYCFNRPSSLFALPWPQSKYRHDDVIASRITPFDVPSAYSPRFTPDGTMLLFLTQRLAVESGVHNATPALLSLSWPTVHRFLSSPKDNKQEVEGETDIFKAETIVAEVWEPEGETAFPGLYTSLLLDNPCLAGSNILLTTVQWRSTTAIVAVNLQSGEVTRISPQESSSSSWTLLAVCKYWIIASESHPGQVSKLYACSVQPRDLGNPALWKWSYLDVYSTSADGLPPTVRKALSSIKARVMTCKPMTGGDDTNFEVIIISCEKQNRPLPTLVMPHGGPHTCYGTQYYMPSSFLAALGYCLLLVNYRGSTGFGEKSIQSLPGHISTNDVADCMSALNVAKEAGFVDPSRVALIGGSHGGFLAAHLAGQHADTFRAVVLRNPVCNIATMVRLTDIPDWCFIEAWGVKTGRQRAGANPTQEDLEKFESVSPIAHVGKVVAPLLMLLGGGDRRVPLDDPKRYLNAIQHRDGAPSTRLVVFPKDGHALDKPQTEFEQWITTAWWLKKHITLR